jgi:glucose-fructose oxidoreductase
VNRQEVACEHTLPLGVMPDAFAQSISTKTPFLCPREMGLRDIRILEAIYASAKQGGTRVELKL